MTESRDSRNPSSPWAPLLWILSFGVIASMGDLLLGIHPAARGFEPAYLKSFGFPVAAFVLLLASGAFLVAWLCVGWPLTRWAGLDRFPTFASTTVFVSVVSVYAGTTDPFRTHNIGATIADVGLICLLGAVPAVLTYRLLAPRSHEWRYRVGLWIARIAIALVAIATVFWAVRYLPSAEASGIWWGVVAVGLAALGVGAKVFAGRELWLIAALSLLILAAPFLPWPDSSLEQTPEAGRGPGGKVLLLTVDTLRADAITPYGAPPDVTPHLQRLAEDSLVFEEPISAGNWTLPGTASLLTGLSVSVHGVKRLHSPLSESIDTLAEWFERSGFVTAAIGGNPHLSSPRLQFQQGFERYYFLPMNYGGSFGGKLYDWLAHTERASGPSTRWLTDKTIDWLRKNHDEDFFLWLHYFDPHLGYRPPEAFAPEGEAPPRVEEVSVYHLWRIRGGEFTPRAGERDWIRKLYSGEVRYIDDEIGKVLAELEALGIYDETIIAFSSDHGEELFDHDGFEHGHTLYDEVISVPLMIKGAGSSLAPGRVSGPVGTERVVPTLLDLVGIPYDPQRFSHPGLGGFTAPPGGETVAEPVPEGAEAGPDGGPETAIGYASAAAGSGVEDPIIVVEGGLFYEPKIAVRMGRYKYIVGLIDGVEELYDVETDPGELYSIAGARPELIETMRGALQAHNEHSERLQQALQIEVTEVELTDETRRQLEALGYM